MMEQLTIDGREEPLDVPEYRAPPPPKPPCPVVSLTLARQKLRGVKASRDMQYHLDAPE